MVNVFSSQPLRRFLKGSDTNNTLDIELSDLETPINWLSSRIYCPFCNILVQNHPLSHRYLLRRGETLSIVEQITLFCIVLTYPYFLVKLCIGFVYIRMDIRKIIEREYIIRRTLKIFALPAVLGSFSSRLLQLGGWWTGGVFGVNSYVVLSF